MRAFHWRRAYAVAVPEVDEEHKSLFRTGGELRDAIVTGAGARTVRAALERLAAQATQHFRHEELEMRTARYPLYEWHHRQHTAARGKIRSLQNRIRRGDREAAAEELDAFGGWLADHILLSDRIWAAHSRYESLRR